ncbi:hypothetical protein ACLMJK_007842 [Lecanora helva]
MLATFLTDVVKNSVGRPRPDLLDRCKPKKGTPEHKLVNIDVCTETNHHVLHDGWRSFPSGHSSLAFSGLGYLAFFFAGQMHIFRPRTDLARVLLALAPLVGATLIAISRLEDYRHDVYDVTVGSILGLLVAYFSYSRYYPSLNSPHCDVPYPSRAEYAAKNGYGKLKDEEARIGSSRTFSADEMEADSEHVPLRDTSRDRGRHVSRLTCLLQFSQQSHTPFSKYGKASIIVMTLQFCTCDAQPLIGNLKSQITADISKLHNYPMVTPKTSLSNLSSDIHSTNKSISPQKIKAPPIQKTPAPCPRFEIEMIQS